MLRYTVSFNFFLALTIATVWVAYAGGGGRGEVPSPPVYSWPPHFSSRHPKVRELLHHYHYYLSAAERWPYHSGVVFNACLPIVESAARNEGEKIALLQLLGEPREITQTAVPEPDGRMPPEQAAALMADFLRTPSDEHPDVEDDEVNRLVRDRMKGELGEAAYDYWLKYWLFCEPMLAEWRVAAAYMQRQEEDGAVHAPSIFWKGGHEEARKCMERMRELTPKSLTDALAHLYSGGWKEAAFHSEVFHKRLFTKPVEAILLGTDYAKELLAKLPFKPQQPLVTSAKAKALINSAYTAMHTLLDHCYGTVVGERYVEEKFRQTAVSLATRYAQLHEGERQEILLHFPVVSSVLLNDGGNCSRQIYNRLFAATDYGFEPMRTKPALVCHLFRKFALFAVFADFVDDQGSKSDKPPPPPPHSSTRKEKTEL